MGNIASTVKRVVEDNGSLERPPKRLKFCEDGGLATNAAAASNDAIEEGAIALPAEVWAMVMIFLDYQSVLSCAATSRLMLRDAMPLVTNIHIHNASEMNANLFSRFRDVREINIYSLLEERELEGVFDVDGEPAHSFAVDGDSAMRVVPFISRFPNLELCSWGGRSQMEILLVFAPTTTFRMRKKIQIEHTI